MSCLVLFTSVYIIYEDIIYEINYYVRVWLKCDFWQKIIKVIVGIKTILRIANSSEPSDTFIS